MAGPCCSSPGNDDRFDRTTARAVARRYRWFGLSPNERRLVRALGQRGLTGTRVLEIGGGLGQLQLALLEHGAAQATNLDLSPNWDRDAVALAADRGVAGRVTRLTGDATDPPPLPEADVVVLHRVVCCTDDWRAMLDTALRVGPRLVAVTFPRDTWWVRALARIGNALERRRGRAFRMRIHPPEELLDHLRGHDLTVAVDVGGVIWRTVVLDAELAPATTG